MEAKLADLEWYSDDKSGISIYFSPMLEMYVYVDMYSSTIVGVIKNENSL